MSNEAVLVQVDGSGAVKALSRTEAAFIRNARSADSFDRSLSRLDRTFARTERASKSSADAFIRTGAAARKMTVHLDAANNNAIKTNSSLLMMFKTLGRASIAVAGLGLLTGGVAGLTGAITGAADKMALMEARLKVAIGANGNLGAAMNEVRNIADKTRSGLDEIGTLYTKIARNSENLGVSLGQVGGATQNFAMLLKVSGATAGESASSILQLGQALGSGVLNGDEFKSLSENASEFMKVLAKSMGVSIGQLKALGGQGKITGQEIVKALTDPKMVADIEKNFGALPVTFADFKTGFANAGMGWTAALMQGMGIDDSKAVMLAKFQSWARDLEPTIKAFGAQLSDMFATVQPIFAAIGNVVGPTVNLLATNLGNVTKFAIAAGAGFLTFKAGMAAANVAGTIGQLINLQKALGATSTMSAVFSVAMKAAQGAVNGFTASLMLNPIVALATAVVAAGVALYQFSDQIQIGTKGMATLADWANVVWDDMIAGITAVGNWFSQTWASIKQWASDAWNSITGWFGPIGDWFAGILEPVMGAFSWLTDGIDFSFSGLVRFIARYVDVIINFFVNGAKLIGNAFTVIPQAIGAAVTGAANFVISGIEKMINNAINGLNKLIGLANKVPGVNIGSMDGVSLGRVNGPAMPSMGDLTAGMGYNSYVEGYFDSVNERADSRAAIRNSRISSPSSNPSDPSSPSSPSVGGKQGGSGKKSETEKAAEKYAELIQKMQDELKLAGMLGHEAELYNKQLEAKKILGSAYGDIQAKEIESLVQQTRLTSALTGMRQEAFEASNQATINSMRRVGLSEREQTVEDALAKHRLDALNKGVTLAEIQSDAWKLEEQKLATILRQNAAYDEQQRKLEDMQKMGRDLIEEYNRNANPRSAAAFNRNERDAAIRSAQRPEDITPEVWVQRVDAALAGSAREFEKDMAEISQAFRDEVIGGLDQVADIIGGKIGNALVGLADAIDAWGAAQRGDYSQGGLLGGVARMFGGPEDNRNAFGKAIEGGIGRMSQGMEQVFSDPLKSMTGSLKDITKSFNPANGGGLVQGIGNVVGGAMQGAAIGSAVAGVGKALWGKFSSTGSQVGGAVGSIFGPIGSFVGSALGGIVGGLFKKSKYGTATITADGITSRGNSAGRVDAAVESGNSINDTLGRIAETLGGSVGSFGRLSIGTYKDNWRVSTTGQTGKLSGRSKNERANEINQGLYNFGKDGQEEAIRFALNVAIERGAITGIRASTNRLLKAGTDIEVQLEKALKFETLFKDMASMKNPVEGAIASLKGEFDQLGDLFREAGASAAEYAELEDYKRLKIKKSMEEQTASFRDFQDMLRGEGSGVSSVTRLNRMMQQFSVFEADIRSGKTVDQNAFTSLGSDIFNLSRDLYGTTSSQFQNTRSRLMGASELAVSQVEANYEKQLVNSASDTNAHLIRNNDLMSEQTDVLREIRDAVQANGNAASGGGGSRAGVNYGGRNLVNSY